MVVKIYGFISLMFFAVNCNTTEPPVLEKIITLKLEDVSCTEAWVKLTINNY